MDQDILVKCLKWSFPLDVGRVQFLETWSLQKTLFGLVFSLMVSEVAPL